MIWAEDPGSISYDHLAKHFQVKSSKLEAEWKESIEMTELSYSDIWEPFELWILKKWTMSFVI